MFPIQQTIFFIIKVILAFYILYMFLPSKLTVFDELADDWTDKLIISLTHSNFYIIILVHTLVALKIYETISLFISIVIFITFLLMWRGSANSSVEKRGVLTYILDFVDGKLGEPGQRKRQIIGFLKAIPKKIMSFFVYCIVHPFDGIAMLAVFAFAAIIRFRHAFHFLYYGASDCYVHLAWTKYLGINKIYLDGVYPYGYEAIVSAMQKLFFIDPSIIIRFLGGIGSLLMVFSIYYVLKKNVKNRYIVTFVGVAAYVFGTELPNKANDIWRQMSALPQEYASIFLLPGLHFLNIYLSTNNKKYLILAAEVLAITVFIHFYAAIFLIVGYVILLLLNINKLFKPKIFTNLLLFLGGGGVLGILPIVTALALGMKFHALSLGFVAESATVNTVLDWKQEIFRYVEVSATLRMTLIFACIVVAYALIRLFFKKSQEYSSKINLFVTLAILSVVTYTQVRAIDIGFPTLMEFSRASTFFGLIVVVLFGVTIYLIEFFPVHKLVKYAAYILLGAFVLNTVFQVQNFKYLLPTGAKLEYDESVYTYYKIKNEFPILNWTIISPVEQYQESMGYGWHYNLWEFVKDTQIERKDKFTFPTDYIFVIIEKRPLDQSKPYSVTPELSLQDAQKPFPEVGTSFEKYYTVYENRRIIEAKAYYWLEEYMKSTENFTIYTENDKIKVYMLKQDGTKPINLIE